MRCDELTPGDELSFGSVRVRRHLAGHFVVTPIAIKPIAKFNPLHAPAGSPTGGQFIAAGSTGPAASGASQLMGAGGAPLTTAQIMAFQRAHGLKVDGIIGSQTAAALLGGKAGVGAITAQQLAALGGGAGAGGKGRKGRSSRGSGRARRGGGAGRHSAHGGRSRSSRSSSRLSGVNRAALAQGRADARAQKLAARQQAHVQRVQAARARAQARASARAQRVHAARAKAQARASVSAQKRAAAHQKTLTAAATRAAAAQARIARANAAAAARAARASVRGSAPRVRVARPVTVGGSPISPHARF